MNVGRYRAGARWNLRRVPPELERAYVDGGWWTDETLGAMVARQLAAHPHGDGRHLVPIARLAGELRRHRRRGAPARHAPARHGRSAGRSRRLPAPQLARSRGRRSPRWPWVDTCWCRSSTSTVARRWRSSSSRAAPRRTSRRSPTATSTTARSSRRPRPRRFDCTSSSATPRCLPGERPRRPHRLGGLRRAEAGERPAPA